MCIAVLPIVTLMLSVGSAERAAAPLDSTSREAPRVPRLP